jgi:hypothetical protein
MRKIKNIAIKTMELGFLEESEKILYNLMEAQIRGMGLLHEETLDTVILLGHNFALSQKWERLAKLQELLLDLDQPQFCKYTKLQDAINSLASLQKEIS